MEHTTVKSRQRTRQSRSATSMKRAICPACGKNYGVVLLWGERTAEEAHQATRGNAVLGGSNPAGQQEDRQCRRCGHQWVALDNTPRGEEQALKTRKAAAPRPVLAQTEIPRRAATQTPAAAPAPRRYGPPPPKPAQPVIALWPSLLVFVLVWVIGFVIMGAVTCYDGWASPSIGRSGACSHHGGVNPFPRIIAFVAALVVAFNFHGFRQRRADRRGR